MYEADGGRLMRSTGIATAALALSAVLLQVARADESALREAVSLPAAAMWLDYKAPGLILAVVRGNDAVVLGFGETAPSSGVVPDGRTIVRIGSIAKAFAGQLLADLASAGTVRLADPTHAIFRSSSCPRLRDSRSRSSTSRHTLPGCRVKSPASRLRTAIRSHTFRGRTTKHTSRRRRLRARPEQPPPTRTSASACSAALWRARAASPTRRCCRSASPVRSECPTPCCGSTTSSKSAS